MKLNANVVGLVASFVLIPMVHAQPTFSGQDNIQASATESLREIKSTVEGYNCDGRSPSYVGWEHPFLKLSFVAGCGTGTDVIYEINYKFIIVTEVRIDKNEIEIGCSSICDFIYVKNRNGLFSLVYQRSNGYIELHLDSRYATRVARALLHLGNLYNASGAKDKFDAP